MLFDKLLNSPTYMDHKEEFLVMYKENFHL